MTDTRWLATFLKWLFAVLAVLSALVCVGACILWAIGPAVPPDAHFGPYKMDFFGQPGTITLRNATVSLTALHGNVQAQIAQAGGLVDTLRQYGLPVLILKAAFFAALFELMRRLFHMVGRGESFTRPTVRLVQVIGLSLLVFSLVFAAAESWFAHAIYAYLVQHASIEISGTPLRLPQARIEVSSGSNFPFGTPLFFSGLLVLALSEVFRQGLLLKAENDLTV